jgi:hypothetical protein
LLRRGGGLRFKLSRKSSEEKNEMFLHPLSLNAFRCQVIHFRVMDLV